MLSSVICVDEFDVHEVVIRVVPHSAVRLVLGQAPHVPDNDLHNNLPEFSFENAFGMSMEGIRRAERQYDLLQDDINPTLRVSPNWIFHKRVDENATVEASNNSSLFKI